MLNGQHGGNDLALDIKLDFSANLNPLGMPEGVRGAVMASADKWEDYPDPFCRSLREKLSERHGIPSRNIVCGNGADDLIYRTVSVLRPESALICSPSFGEYRKALAEQGCRVNEYVLTSVNGFELTEGILGYIAGNDMVMLASPNNPTGSVIAPRLLKSIAEECLRSGACLVCDESFIGFAVNGRELTALNCLNDKVIVLRSFTKLFAMAGLRLGYGICGSEDMSDKISASGQYWSVSVPAQAAGLAALSETGYMKETVSYIKKQREYLASELAGMGVKVFPSEADFILFRARADIGSLLLREKILIRSCADYSGLDGSYFRTAVRTEKENRQLIAAIRRIMDV